MAKRKRKPKQQSARRSFWLLLAAGVRWQDLLHRDIKAYFIAHELGHVRYPGLADDQAEILSCLGQFTRQVPAALALEQLISHWTTAGQVEAHEFGYQKALLLLLDTYVREKASGSRTEHDQRHLEGTGGDWREFRDLEIALLYELVTEPETTIWTVAGRAAQRAQRTLFP